MYNVVKRTLNCDREAKIRLFCRIPPQISVGKCSHFKNRRGLDHETSTRAQGLGLRVDIRAGMLLNEHDTAEGVPKRSGCFIFDRMISSTGENFRRRRKSDPNSRSIEPDVALGSILRWPNQIPAATFYQPPNVYVTGMKSLDGAGVYARLKRCQAFFV